MPNPTVEQLITLANECLQRGELDRVEALLEQVISAQPAHASARLALGQLMLRRGNVSVAETHLKAALAADPNAVAAANQLGMLYWTTGRAELAAPLLRDVTAKAHSAPEPWFNLGGAQMALGEYDAAAESLEKAIALRPSYANAWINLARVRRLAMRPRHSLDALRRAAEVAPSPAGFSNLVFQSMFSPDVSPGQLAELAAQWERRFVPPLTAPEPQPAADRPREPGRVLNVAYMGPTFRRHAVGWLIEPVLSGHDRKHFRVFCYSDVTNPDDVTDRIRGCDLIFRDTASLNDEQLIALIRQEEIDILVDLNLHMARSRLGVVARRAAPVQINYLAYPLTSGLSAMDYRVTDDLLDPPSEARHGPEALIRLGHCFWLYRPDADAPPPAANPPASATGEFTFANLNDTRKLNEHVVASWAQILRSVPRSRLILLSDNVAAQRRHLLALFADAGIDERRIEIFGPAPHAEHLGRYLQADLSLDPFPYGGHTTALDSLWMGVPVLTVAGDAPYRRGAASILPRVGLSELVTASKQQYVETAIRLANTPGEVARLRHDLRRRMRASSICDEAGFVAEYERGLRRAWERYCEGLSPCDISAASA